MSVIVDCDLVGYKLGRQDDRTELPGLWLKQEEILTLLLIQHMIGQLELGVLGPRLKLPQNRLNDILASQGAVTGMLSQRVKLVHAGKRAFRLKPFQTVAQATLTRKQLSIKHFNRQTG